jgi:hypothetical protein
MSRITRQESVEQSVQDYVRDGLTTRGFPMPQIELKDAFEQREFDGPLDKEYVAMGFNFDDGGQVLELGSNLRQYSHTIEIFVMATTPDRGSGLGYAIREILEGADRLPLKDVSQSGQPVIDQLYIDPVSVERQPIPDPDPWEENVWLLRVPVIDEYDPSLA